jgi:hypothetical protein
MNPEVIVYHTFDFTRTMEGSFATFDAIANITSQIAMMGVYYGIDWELGQVYYGSDGNQCIELEFKESETAMLVKLKGLKNILGQNI